MVQAKTIINWIKPSRAELEIEWKTEGIDCLWFVGYPSKRDQDRYRNHFLDNIAKFTTVEKIDDIAIAHQVYMTSSVEQLEINIQHMRKDVRGIEDSIMFGTPTMPLFLCQNRKELQENGELKILGGRTRSSIALMSGKKVTGFVIDKQIMDQVFQPLKKADFLKRGWILSVFESQKVRSEIIAYIEGAKNSLPKFENILGKCDEIDVLEEIEGIKNLLSYT